MTGRKSRAHLPVPICSSKSYFSLQGSYFSHLSHPSRAGKNVCGMPRGRIQDSEVLTWEKTGRVPDSARQQSERSHYRNQGGY